MNAVRSGLDARSEKLPASDKLKARLVSASASLDDLRKKIVATKEGGMITGEERLREFLAELYGSVVGYEGRPTDSQVQRGDALGRELADVSQGIRAVDHARAACHQQAAVDAEDSCSRPAGKVK